MYLQALLSRRNQVPLALEIERGRKMKKMLLSLLIVVAIAMSITFATTGVFADGDGTGNEEPTGTPAVPVIDEDYDDGWVAGFPDTIAGYTVGHITTPKSRACSSLPMIYLRSTQSTLDEFLNNAPDINSLDEQVKSLSQSPSAVRWSFSPEAIDSTTAAARDAAWNTERAQHGCPPPWDDTEEGDDDDATRGWAIFQNTDAGDYTDDNAQSVRIQSPATIGTSQVYFSAALNNVVTHIYNNGSAYGLQTGMQFDPGDVHGGTMIGWADSSRNLTPEEFTEVPYEANHWYYFTNSYTNSVWWMCAGDDDDLDELYQCVSSSNAPGTHLIESPNTSVWFENANYNSNWHNGFPANIVLYDAHIYRNGQSYNWKSEDRLTVHDCGQGEYPVSGAMTGSLKNAGTAQWTLSGIPLYCD